MNKQIESIKIEDPLDQTTHAIEVIVTLAADQKRWCAFMTPEIAKNCGDFLAGTQVRVHQGAPHIFLVSEISAEIIYGVLNQIDADGDIFEATAALD